jgi:tetraacyldisaccharide 4'-kinase
MNASPSKILYPLTFPYRWALSIDKQCASSRALPCPVISVGNVTWGGTGKTPVVIMLAKQLLKQGRKPAVLLRGNRKKSRGNECFILDKDHPPVQAETVGDEAFLIAEYAPGTIVSAGSDRYASAMTAMGKYGPDTFILDDGFQHWKLKRDLDIVCVNARNPFGNGCLIPAGILREPLSSLARAGVIALTNADLVNDDELAALEKKLSLYTPSAPIRIGCRATAVRPIAGGSPLEIKDLYHRAVVAVSAIGENRGFKSTLRKNNLQVIEHFAFRDHHWFTPREMQSVIARFSDDCLVVTTTKDAVRLKGILPQLKDEDARRFYALETEVYIISGAERWQQQIANAARSS